MGVASALALGKLEQSQLDSSLRLVIRQSVSQIAKNPDGFAGAYISLSIGAHGELTPDSVAGEEPHHVPGPLTHQAPPPAEAPPQAPAPPPPPREPSPSSEPPPPVAPA